MRRLWLAAALLGTIVGLCLLSTRYQRRQITILLEELDKIEESYQAGNQAQAHSLALDFQKDFDHRTRLFPCFLNHGELNGCRESVAILPAILALEEPQEFAIESVRCRTQLEYLQDIELPTWKNIF